MYLIEPVQERHIEAIYRAFDTVARERAYYQVIQAGSIENFSRWMKKNMNHGFPMFVAVAEESVIGWCTISKYDEQYMRHCGILFMGLLPDWRCCGIGRQLLHGALEAAWRLGLARVQLEVYADNEPAIQLYQRLGFVVEGQRCCAHVVDGQYRDVLDMAVLVGDVVDSGSMLQVA